MGMTNGHQQHGGQLMSPVDTKMEEGDGDGKKRKRGRAAADDKDKKGKKAKDMFAPKRPPSAYLLFQNEVRKGMQQKYPGLAYSEVLGKVSEKWSTLTPEQKLVGHLHIQFGARSNSCDRCMSLSQRLRRSNTSYERRHMKMLSVPECQTKLVFPLFLLLQLIDPLNRRMRTS